MTSREAARGPDRHGRDDLVDRAGQPRRLGVHGHREEGRPDELLVRVPGDGRGRGDPPGAVPRVGSTAIGPSEWLALDATVHAGRAREAPPDGVVITHGTATLEETRLLPEPHAQDDGPSSRRRPAAGQRAQLRRRHEPAQRGARGRRAGGARARRARRSSTTRSRPRARSTKASTLRLETFRSPDLGMLGYADPDGREAIYRRPARRHAPGHRVRRARTTELPRVDIAYSYAGADGTAIDAFVAAGARASSRRRWRPA